MQQQSENAPPVILMVEDDDDTRRVYCILLRHSGFEVVEAHNGLEGFDRALDAHPDLILMDMNLPTCDGWEAARRIKDDARTSNVPLVAFSSVVDSITDLRGRVALFDGFIAKPISPSGLVRRVAAYLNLLGPVRASSTARFAGATRSGLAPGNPAAPVSGDQAPPAETALR